MKWLNLTQKNNKNMRILSIFLGLILVSCSIQNEKQKHETPTFVISFENDNDVQFIAFDSKSDSLFVKNGPKDSRVIVGYKVNSELKKSIFEVIDFHLNSSYLIKIGNAKRNSRKTFNVKMRIGENFGSQLEIKILNVNQYKEVSLQLDSLIQTLKKDKILDSNW